MPSGIGDRRAKTRFPWSFRELDRFAATSPARGYLTPLAIQDFVWFFDDFLGDAVNLDMYTTAETGDGTEFAIPATHLVGGGITSVTATSSGDAQTLYGPRIWKGDNNCGLEVRLKFDVVTTLMYEVGFIDSASDLAIPVGSDIDTPAFAGGTSDAAVLHMDQSQTLTTTAFLTDGSTSNMNATAQTLSPTFTPTAATYARYRVGIAGDIPSAMINGGSPTSTSTGVIGHRTEGGTLVRLFVATRTRTTAAKTTDIDYVAIWQDRDVRVA